MATAAFTGSLALLSHGGIAPYPIRSRELDLIGVLLGDEIELVASIRTWIANRNDDPKPLVWHKTADEILDSLAAYCQ